VILWVKPPRHKEGPIRAALPFAVALPLLGIASPVWAEAAPNACVASIADALVGEWETTRIWRAGASVDSGTAHVSAPASTRPNVYTDSVTDHATGLTLRRTSTVTELGTNDVTYDGAGEETEIDVATRTFKCDTTPRDGWRVLEISYQKYSGATISEISRHIEVSDQAFIVIEGERPQGAHGLYRWSITTTGKRVSP